MTSATQEEIGNARFQNALARRAQSVPPIWLMRQAGRYHKHYQALRQRHSFMDLCKQPDLAAEVAFFPLEALGMGLEYTDGGPRLGWKLNPGTFVQLRSVEDAWPHLLFQGEAMRATRERLPEDRSLIGFVGGPWTLFVYAVEGSHAGSLTASKKLLALFPRFCEVIVPLLARNIELQLNNGAEVVMIFDTAAGELTPDAFQTEVTPQLELLTQRHSSRIGYYSKGTQPAHLRHSLFNQGSLAGVGVDHRWDMSEALGMFRPGFVQGNFDQALLLSERDELQQRLTRYLDALSRHDRSGWVCGLGHGVLPGTPEDNVRLFVDTVRKAMQ